jgi:hypothetical protein
MIIWGSKGKTKIIGQGDFYCPRCRTTRAYKHHQVGKYFTLYFIPLFQTKRIGEYIECQICFTPFEKSVLAYDQELNLKIQRMIDLISEDIDAGIPINFIYQNLIDERIDEDAANNLLSTASGGNFTVCRDCNFIFTEKHNYCSNCGQSLVSL